MATTVSKVQLKMKLNDGSNALVNLPTPINETLTDEDSGEALYTAAFGAIQAAYESDDGAVPVSMDVSIIKTTTINIASNLA